MPSTIEGLGLLLFHIPQMMENGGMSDISLPPLPPFGASETGSQVDGSDEEEEGLTTEVNILSLSWQPGCVTMCF